MGVLALEKEVAAGNVAAGPVATWANVSSSAVQRELVSAEILMMLGGEVPVMLITPTALGFENKLGFGSVILEVSKWGRQESTLTLRKSLVYLDENGKLQGRQKIFEPHQLIVCLSHVGSKHKEV